MFEYRGLLERPARNAVGWEEVMRGFDQFFREFEQEGPLTSFGHAPTRFAEEDGQFVLTVEAPGLTEKDVKVDLNEGVLTVSAERAVEVPEGYNVRRRERAPTRFSRSFVLGNKVDPEKTTAEIKDGILTVSIAKAAGQKRNIAVKVS